MKDVMDVLYLIFEGRSFKEEDNEALEEASNFKQ